MSKDRTTPPADGLPGMDANGDQWVLGPTGELINRTLAEERGLWMGSYSEEEKKAADKSATTGKYVNPTGKSSLDVASKRQPHTTSLNQSQTKFDPRKELKEQGYNADDPMVNSGQKTGDVALLPYGDQAYRPSTSRENKPDHLLYGHSNAPKMVPSSTMAYFPEKWYYDRTGNKQEYKQLVGLMENAGLDTDGGDLSKVMSYWNGVILPGASHNPDMTPMQYAEFAAANGTFKDLGGNSNRGGGGIPTTRQVVDLTNKFDAEAIVNQALGQWLGRDATDKEVKQFWKQLNKDEKKNPKTVSPYGVKGGYNAQLAAEKYAESRDDYVDVQAKTVYAKLFEQALRGRMDGTVEGMLQ